MPGDMQHFQQGNYQERMEDYGPNRSECMLGADHWMNIHCKDKCRSIVRERFVQTQDEKG